MEISICIVTFKERADYIKRLISQIRQDHEAPNVDIVLAINGNNEEIMDENYRKDMLQLCHDTPNCYPLFCPEFKSLPKLWNTLTIFSRTEYNVILSDDVEYANQNIIGTIKQHIETTSDEFFKINGGFSHFVLTKKMLHKLKYFDERFIAHGEEDGDIIHQFELVNGRPMGNINIHGLYNKAAYGAEANPKKMDFHVHNKPRFNREFVIMKYQQDPNGINGMSPTPISVKPGMEVVQQYPYEEFVRSNKHNISKFEEVIFNEQE